MAETERRRRTGYIRRFQQIYWVLVNDKSPMTLSSYLTGKVKGDTCLHPFTSAGSYYLELWGKQLRNLSCFQP